MSKNEIKLKPCPFCGAILYHAIQNYYYMCKTEGCFLNTHFVSESEVGSYNTRDPKNIYLMEHGEAAYVDKLEKQISTLQEKAEESKQVVAHYQSTVDGLQEKLRWIPVSERLPEDNNKEYLWCCNVPDKEILMFGDCELHYEGGYGFTHWREIDLPTGEEESK